MTQPNKKSVAESIREFVANERTFLARHSRGQPPKAHYLLHKGKLYPLKAIWGAAHKPSMQTRDFNTADARRGMKELGFDTFIKGETAVKQYHEGERIRREVRTFMRKANVAIMAKEHYGAICQACGFRFVAIFGELGNGYIECHHIDQLSGRDGQGEPTKIEDVTVLCANCHRMIHRKTPSRSLRDHQPFSTGMRADCRCRWV